MAELRLNRKAFEDLIRTESSVVEALTHRHSEEVEEQVKGIADFKGQGEDFTKVWEAFGITQAEGFIQVESMAVMASLIDAIDLIFSDMRPGDLPIHLQNVWNRALEAWGIDSAGDDDMDYIDEAAEGLRGLYHFVQDLPNI